MIGYALYYVIRKNLSIAMPLLGEIGISKVQLGAFLTCGGIVYGLGRFLNGIVADRNSARKVMALGLAISAPTMSLMVYMPTLWLSCVMMFFFGLGGGFFDCNLYAGLFDVVAPRYRAAAMGIYLCGAFFLGCPATAVLGWVGQTFSLQHGIAIFGATYALGALAIFIARAVFYRRDAVSLDEEGA